MDPFEPNTVTELMDGIESRVVSLDADRRTGTAISHDRMIQAYIDGAHLTQIIEGMQRVLDSYVDYLSTVTDALQDFDEFDRAAFADAARHQVKTQYNEEG